MIDMNEINDEIAKLEHSATTYGNCEKLSVLYAVRQNFGGQEAPAVVQSIPAQHSYAAKSEFLEAIADKPIEGVLSILDEHMSAIEVVYPKEYRALPRKIRTIK